MRNRTAPTLLLATGLLLTGVFALDGREAEFDMGRAAAADAMFDACMEAADATGDFERYRSGCRLSYMDWIDPKNP